MAPAAATCVNISARQDFRSPGGFFQALTTITARVSRGMMTDKQAKSEHWLTRKDRRRWIDDREWPSRREWRREEALADWLGDERRAEVFAELRPASRSMDELVSEAMAAVGHRDMLLLADLREHWEDIVGADNARQSSPLSVEGDTLRIEIFSATWFYIFEHQHKARFIQLLSDYTHEAITRIQFVPRGYRPPQRF